MQRQSVSSSNLSAIGYDAESQVLEIEFKDGKVYAYSNVPESEYDALMSAASHGKYFSANIRNNYSFEKL